MSSWGILGQLHEHGEHLSGAGRQLVYRETCLYGDKLLMRDKQCLLENCMAEKFSAKMIR